MNDVNGASGSTDKPDTDEDDKTAPTEGDAQHLQPPETDSLTGGGAPPGITALQPAETDDIIHGADHGDDA